MWQFAPSAEKCLRSSKTQHPEHHGLLFDTWSLRTTSITGVRRVQPEGQWCKNMVDPVDYNIQSARFYFAMCQTQFKISTWHSGLNAAQFVFQTIKRILICNIKTLMWTGGAAAREAPLMKCILCERDPHVFVYMSAGVSSVNQGSVQMFWLMRRHRRVETVHSLRYITLQSDRDIFNTLTNFIYRSDLQSEA